VVRRANRSLLLEDDKVKKNSNVVLTKHPYSGPFFISEIIKGDDNIGASYRLIDVKTGKTHKLLVSSDRLKNCNASRVNMANRISPIINNRVNYTQRLEGADTAPPSDATSELTDDKMQPEMNETMEPALRIIRQRMRNKLPQFLVEFCDRSKYWCSEVTPELL